MSVSLEYCLVSLKHPIAMLTLTLSVYDISILIASSPSPTHIHRRFSSFVALRSAIVRSLPPDLHPQIPQLPPKAPWARYRAGFLENRRRALESWLVQILLHPDIGGLEVVRQWVVND